MLPQIQYFIFINLCLLQVVFCQRIQLSPYNETKNCTISLVEENDIILMYGKVDFNGNLPASSVVNFEIKRKTETSFHFLFFLKVPEDCDKDFYNFKCLKTYDHKVFLLYLKMTAHTEITEADVIAELVYRETSFYSEIRKLPIVYDSQTDVVAVYANDQVVHFQQIDVSANDTQVTIVSTVREKFALESKLQLMDLETGVLLKSGKEIVVYNKNIKGRSNLNLKYSVCNFVRNISFSITTNKTTASLHLTTEINPALIILSTVYTLTLAMMFCSFYYVRIYPTVSEKQLIEWGEERRSRHIHGDNNEEESLSLINEITTHWNCESNENSLQEVNTRKSDDQHKKETNTTNVPIRYRYKDFEQLLKVLSQLTCCINLKKQSFSTHSNKLGCGLVTGVVKYFNGVGINTIKTSQSHKCPCPKCLKSKSRSNTWAEIFITTSSTIMKTKNYHKQITCVLSTVDNATTELHDLSVKQKDPKKSGLCVLKHVTCDQSLINKLLFLLEERSRLEEKVQDIFHQDRHHDQIYFAIVYREDDTKHTCTGSWSEEKTKYNVRTYHYEPEIPFSNIGAPVVLLGYSNIEFEYNQTRNSLGEVSRNNLSTAVFTIEYAQKVKSQ